MVPSRSRSAAYRMSTSSAARGCTRSGLLGAEPVQPLACPLQQLVDAPLRHRVPHPCASLPFLRLLDLLQPQHLARAAVAAHQRQRRVVGVHGDRMLARWTG